MDIGVKKSRPSADKRFWSEEEDKKLVDALLELANTRKYNVDNGFKLGHYTAVEKMLSVSLPDSKLKAEPHIASRMKTLKKHFNIVHDMLCGPNSSGFGYDDNNKYVNVKKPVWGDYLKSHKDAQKFKEKPFPYYSELCIVFGKDRAIGKDVEIPTHVIEELNMEAHENQL
ncbi:hypothetical protein ACH5RR_006334 [Cinchona calisaya]|uniref:Myb/SANT-like domain-containing protein n=1 Tax=Cinchona calisaya TaxID=153742 RepID=A0ABD3ANP8_9GENT